MAGRRWFGGVVMPGEDGVVQVMEGGAGGGWGEGRQGEGEGDGRGAGKHWCADGWMWV